MSDYKSALLKQNRKIFKTDDLALLWEITNRNTLRTTIKRYLKKRVLFGLRRGVYSVTPPNKLSPYLLGTAYIKGFCYLGLQSVLAEHGLINQSPQTITLIGTRSLRFTIGPNDYLCRKMASKYLHNLTGLDLSGDYPTATPARAIADTLYYQPQFHFDAPIKRYLKEVKLIQKEVFI